MTSFTDGAALLLGLLLCVAGLLKLASPGAFAHALQRLLPERLGASRSPLVRSAALIIGSLEVVVGTLLFAAPTLPPTLSSALGGVSTGLYCGFVAVVAVAMRKGAACGCFSSFSDGPAGGAELGRAGALAALSASLLGLDLGVDAPHWSATAPLWALVLACAVAAVAGVGARVRPHPRGAARLELPRAAIWRRSAFLLGRVTSYTAHELLAGGGSVTAEEREMAINAAVVSANMTAFCDWLGERAAAIEWESARAQRTEIQVSATERVAAIALEIPLVDGLRLVVTVPAAETPLADTIVRAHVDGELVLALGGHVHHDAPRGATTTRAGGPSPDPTA